MKCRHCNATLSHKFLDLGFAPPSNALLTTEKLLEPETYYPLRIYVCDGCWLVQTQDYSGAEDLFDAEYPYFSSISKSWVTHSKKYVEDITKRLGLKNDSFVVELAANDGYLLQFFLERKIPCLGIEPTKSTADAAEAIGVPILRKFFGSELATTLAANGKRADLVIGNNVFAHVPDINDFTKGIATLLKDDGVVTLEFPHLMRLIQDCQFDTIYHEHYSYLSLYSVCQIFDKAGLMVFDVEELKTHGGSLRIYGCLKNAKTITKDSVSAILELESNFGMRDINTYQNFQSRVNVIKDNLLKFLIEQKCLKKKVIAYGAASKGVMLLNYAGIKEDLISAVYDAAPSKQAKYLPGNHLKILSPKALENVKPDYILVLPWNIYPEISSQLREEFPGNYKLVTAVPCLRVYE